MTTTIAQRDTILVETIEQIDARPRWLSAWTIHHANHLRDSRDGLKVGGHQASCASISTIMAAFYFTALRPQDKVAVKPHARAGAARNPLSAWPAIRGQLEEFVGLAARRAIHRAPKIAVSAFTRMRGRGRPKRSNTGSSSRVAAARGGGRSTDRSRSYPGQPPSVARPRPSRSSSVRMFDARRTTAAPTGVSAMPLARRSNSKAKFVLEFRECCG